MAICDCTPGAAGDHDPFCPAGPLPAELTTAEPHVDVPAGTIGTAAEVLHLISELIHYCPGPAIDPQLAALMAAKGADPAPAMAWLTTTITTLAGELHGLLETQGITADSALDQFNTPITTSRRTR